MSTSAQQIIEEGYAWSNANDPGKLAVEGELLAVLNRLYLTFYTIAAAGDPARYSTRSNLAALSGSPPSVALPTFDIDIRRVQDSNGNTVNLIPLEEIKRTWHIGKCVYRQGSSLVSRATTADPIAGDILTMFYLDSPTELTALATNLDARFPTKHHLLLSVNMGLYLATKDKGRDQNEFAKTKTFRDTLLEMFIKTSGLTVTALQTPHGGAIVQKINQIIGLPG